MKNLNHLHLAGAKLIDPKPKFNLRFVPKGSWLEVKRVPNRFRGAIELTSDGAQYEALVIAVGPDVKNCAVGDYIVARQVDESTYAGETHYLVRDLDNNIVAVVEETVPTPNAEDVQ